MYVSAMIPCCDFTKRDYDECVNGALVVAQGATGRWCAVMYAGPEFIAEKGIKPITFDEAYARVEKEGGYADF